MSTTNPIRAGAKRPELVRLWTDSMVYVAFDLEAETPEDIDEDFGPEWLAAGILDGDAGVPEDVDAEESDHYGWGGILMRSAYGKVKLTHTFTSFEDNEVTKAVRWGGPAVDGKLGLPKPVRVRYALELYDEGTGYAHRYIDRRYTELRREGTYERGEEDPASYPILATIFPDPDGWLFDEQYRDEE